MVVIYAECLLILQYIYGFDLTNEELPYNCSGSDFHSTNDELRYNGSDRGSNSTNESPAYSHSGYRLDEIGIVKYEYPVIPLGIKVLVSAALSSVSVGLLHSK